MNGTVELERFHYHRIVTVTRAEPDFAAVAALMADGARAAMLNALAGPHALPASELAAIAGVSLPTASHHLGKLVDGGLIRVERHGRHRYYGLTGPDVVRAVEALSALAPQRPVKSLRESVVSETLRAGRTCYDHLAGELGVAIADALVDKGVVDRSADGMTLGPNAADWCASFGIELPPAGRRQPVRACLDWSERRYHLAGGLGAAIATELLERGWVERVSDGRAVRLSADGRRGLGRELGLAV
jgi:DNA-binding transcriptional ArsR family regulator